MKSRMTADECIDRIVHVLEQDITISEGPEISVDGSSTTIVYPGGCESLERLFEIGNIIRDYKRQQNG